MEFTAVVHGKGVHQTLLCFLAPFLPNLNFGGDPDEKTSRSI